MSAARTHRLFARVLFAVTLVAGAGCKLNDGQNAQRLGTTTADAAVAPDLGVAHDLVSTWPAYDLYGWSEPDLAWPLPPPDAGDVTPTPCPGDGGLCKLPPSVCANGGYLVYYENARCVGGLCQFDKKLHFCDHGCQVDGCYVAITSRSVTTPCHGT